MIDNATATAQRIMAIDWTGSFERTASRVALLREYLRRAAWWAKDLEPGQWPFFDIAGTIEPTIRADPRLIRRVEDHLASKLKRKTSLVTRTCESAMHFATLLDSRTQLPQLPATVMRPFEPLLLMFERGGGFRIEGSGLIEVDIAGVPKGTIESCKNRAELSLDPAVLDALDAAGTR